MLRFAGRAWPEDPGTARRVASKALLLAVSLAVAVSGVVLALTPWLAERVFEAPDVAPLLAVLAGALPLAVVARVGAAATRVTRRMRFGVVVEEVGQPVLLFGALLAVAGLGGSMVVLAIAAGLSFAVAGLLALWWVASLLPERPTTAEIPSSGQLLRYALPTAAAGTLGVLLPWLDRLFVGAYRPEADVGLYSAASQASLVIVMVLAAFNGIFAPMIAGLAGDGDLRRLGALYRTATRWGVLAVTPLVAVLVWAPEDLLSVTYGPAYAAAGGALSVLALGQGVNAATGAVGYLLMMSGRERLWLGLSAAAVTVNVFLNVLWIPRFGLLGAASATAVSVAGLFLAGTASVVRGLGVAPYGRGSTRLALVVAAAVTAGQLAAAWSGPAATGRVVGVLVASGAVTAVGWWLTRRQVDRDLWSALIRRR